MARRFVPLLIGEDAPPLRAPSVRALRTNARKKRTVAKRKPAKKRAAKKRPAKKRPAKKRPAKKRATKSSRGDFEHLRVRSPSSFKKPTFKTIPWAWAPAYEQAFAKKKLGLRTIPKGTKVISGTFKPGAKKDRIRGKRVAYYAHGIQAVLVPIKGGKTAKSPRGTKRLAKKKAQRVVKRARRNPAGTTTRGEDFAHHHVRATSSFQPGSYRTVPPSHVGAAQLREAKRKARLARLPRGAKLVVGKFRKGARGRPTGKRGEPLAWGVVKILTPATRGNPGRLAILANPLPKPVEDAAKAMRGVKRQRFLAYYASLKPGDQRRLVKGLQLYKRRHKVPCSDFELKRCTGARPKIEVGVGRAQAIEYHANKGYKGSSKRGTPYRHEFENGQHVVSDENGRKLEIVDRKGARRKTVTTNWIYH